MAHSSVSILCVLLALCLCVLSVDQDIGLPFITTLAPNRRRIEGVIAIVWRFFWSVRLSIRRNLPSLCLLVRIVMYQVVVYVMVHIQLSSGKGKQAVALSKCLTHM